MKREVSSALDPQRPSALLIGTGHAHLFTLKRAAEFTRRGFDLTVVAPENFWYSGMATGVVGGRYTPEQDQVDVAALVRVGGAHCRFIRDRAESIDPRKRSVRLASGDELSYDVLSLNLGSQVHPIPGATDRVFPIKPLHELARLRRELEGSRGQQRVVIAGGGASGSEIAANVRALLGDRAEITILARGSRLLPGFSDRSAAALERWLKEREIGVRLDSGVARLENQEAVTSRGDRVPFDFLVNATGLHSPRILSGTGLPVSDRGELLIDRFLRSTGDSRIFGGGDCVKMVDHDLPKIGVYAIRQSPIIFENLLAALAGAPLREFHPQAHCLLILNLGSGVGLARWRGFYWLGRAAFWLKDRIDRQFLARYQTPH